jgi:hypothetical protein
VETRQGPPCYSSRFGLLQAAPGDQPHGERALTIERNLIQAAIRMAEVDLNTWPLSTRIQSHAIRNLRI